MLIGPRASGDRPRFARRATLRRAARLLNEFRHEQPDPARFYGAIARDTTDLVVDVCADLDIPTAGALLLDVGGGPGYFAEAIAAEGIRYVSVEPNPDEMHAAGIDARGSIRGSGTALPIRSGVVDICLSSNVAEHVADPWTMAEEMLRVTRPGGVAILSYTMFYGPFGGHETGPWHFLGGEYAARRYARVHGREPKNRFGRSLFPITATAGLSWAAGTDAGDRVAAFPRYHPRWAWWIVRVPLLRELLTSNLVLVLRAR